jgi:hypothetical protein
MAKKTILDLCRDNHAGNGSAMATLIDSAVITHSDSPPSASDAATAWVSRDEATGALGLLKPATPDDRIMIGILKKRGANHPQQLVKLAAFAGNIAAAADRTWQNRGE